MAARGGRRRRCPGCLCLALVSRPYPAASPRAAIAPAHSPVLSAPAFHIELATEDEISDHVATSLTVFRFADNPRVLVLDFASLREQGEMLNRVAAFVEKAGMPRDRVLTDSELDAAIRANGDTVETFYLGHDYAASALARFFERADSQRITLDPQEEKLRALLREEGWLTEDVMAGLISLPAVGSDPRITARSAGRSCATSCRTVSSSAIPPMPNTCTISG